EDEPAVRSLSRLALETSGYSVLEAQDGGDAILISSGHQGPIDLLVADVVMPGTGGRQVAQILRAQRPAMKVLFVSAYAQETVVRHGVFEGEVAFLPKPFTPGVLAAKVREVLDHAGERAVMEKERLSLSDGTAA